MENEKDSIAKPLRAAAIVPAAGAGVRMGTETAKQFLDFHGRPLLAVTLESFQACPVIDMVILVVPPGDVASCRSRIVEAYNLGKVKKVVAGGARRQDSVRLGLEASGGLFDLIVIHDGVRPCVSTGLIERAVAAAGGYRAVITALPAKETVKEVDKEGMVVNTYDRGQVWLVQTPQVFRYDDLLSAHHRALEEGWKEATDDAALIERMGIPVKVIEGSEENIKVTTPRDLELAKHLLGKQS